jgi:hypothetical protein
LARSLKDQKEKVQIPNVPEYIDPHFKQFLLDLENSLASFKNRCPRPEFSVRIDSMIRITRFERARTPQSDYDAVQKQVDEGACTVEEIAEEVYLSPAEIKTFCVHLVGCEPPSKKEDPTEAGRPYEWRAVGANTEVARGSRTYGIFRKDAPAGSDFYSYRPNADGDEEHF